jgi:hypothetical protein
MCHAASASLALKNRSPLLLGFMGDAIAAMKLGIGQRDLPWATPVQQLLPIWPQSQVLYGETGAELRAR